MNFTPNKSISFALSILLLSPTGSAISRTLLHSPRPVVSPRRTPRRPPSHSLAQCRDRALASGPRHGAHHPRAPTRPPAVCVGAAAVRARRRHDGGQHRVGDEFSFGVGSVAARRRGRGDPHAAATSRGRRRRAAQCRWDAMGQVRNHLFSKKKLICFLHFLLTKNEFQFRV
jgi:hypothetical protein